MMNITQWEKKKTTDYEDQHNSAELLTTSKMDILQILMLCRNAQMCSVTNSI